LKKVISSRWGREEKARFEEKSKTLPLRGRREGEDVAKCGKRAFFSVGNKWQPKTNTSTHQHNTLKPMTPAFACGGKGQESQPTIDTY